MASLIAASGGFAAGQKNGRAQFITAVHQAADLVIHSLERQVKRSEEHMERAEEAFERCETGHQECREKLLAMEDRITVMLLDPPPNYTPSDLRRVGGAE